MTENNLFTCSVCLNEKYISEKFTNFFCECKYDICEACYDYYYINNELKCMICKKIDLKQHYQDFFVEIKNIYKTFIELKKYCRCECKLNKIV